jgi:hypothetical protein
VQDHIRCHGCKEISQETGVFVEAALVVEIISHLVLGDLVTADVGTAHPVALVETQNTLLVEALNAL